MIFAEGTVQPWAKVLPSSSPAMNEMTALNGEKEALKVSDNHD